MPWGGRTEMAGGVHRASRLAGRVVALAAVVHSAVVVLLAAEGLVAAAFMEPVAVPDPLMAIIAATAHVIAIGLVAAGFRTSARNTVAAVGLPVAHSGRGALASIAADTVRLRTIASDFSITSLTMVYADALAAATCVATAGLLWLAGSASWLTLPCVLLAALVSATHAAAVLLLGVGAVGDDLQLTFRQPTELAPGVKVKVLKEDCCGRTVRYGVLQRKAWADEWWVQMCSTDSESLERVPARSLFARDDGLLCVPYQPPPLEAPTKPGGANYCSWSKALSR